MVKAKHRVWTFTTLAVELGCIYMKSKDFPTPIATGNKVGTLRSDDQFEANAEGVGKNPGRGNPDKKKGGAKCI